MVVTPYRWPLSSYLELGALPTAVPCARLHVRHLLWEWGLDRLTEPIELLVSEIVTNAVQAAAGQDAAVCLRLSSDYAQLRIEVWDADPRPPAKAPIADGVPDLEAEGGRGLFLVAALSTRWGWVPTQGPAGKVVWCELDAERPVSDTDAPPLLPQRIPGAVQVRTVAVMNDPDILRRLRDGLRNLDCS
jgi:anti-sigma regulatory factor (Ser/Thr protein kinase)